MSVRSASVCDEGASDVGSMAEAMSQRDSNMSSAMTDSKTANTFGKFSAFTAPPRYRNSGAFVHGTKFRNFKSIMQHGLKAVKSEIFMIDEVRPDGRVPGLQNPPEILIFIDETKARTENMEFEYDARSGTWKTTGIGGVIRPWFFQKVVDQRKGSDKGNVLFQSKEDPMMQANIIKGPQRPRYLMHATYWENVFGILSDGIVPAKNPTSSLRQPFTSLLQGAESHVYTVQATRNGPLARMSGRRASDAGTMMWTRTVSEPEVVPEEEETAAVMGRKVTQHEVGLERPPDAYFIIDTQKAQEMGMKIDLVQSSDREDTIFVQGNVPREVLTLAKANDPVDLPESLRANIVDPRSFEDIPIIDLSLDEATLVDKMRYACEVVGFMQVTGHGVDWDLQRRHKELQQRFFALPEAVKRRLALSEDSPVRGYFGKGGENLDNVLQEEVDKSAGKEVSKKTRKDNKEALDLNGVPWSKPKGGYVASIFGKPSQLPEAHELEGFREVVDEYSREMFKLSKRILSVMARVLGKPANFFEQFLTAPVATHRLLHYWPIKDFSEQIGVGEHTDYGLLTVLKQDHVGGLQVLNAKDGAWVHCCPVQNAFVVNLGDMMSRWTAGRFKSTIHRVVNVSPQERYSVPYFLEPDMETVIVPGAICDGAYGKDLDEHQRRCGLRRLWSRARENFSQAATSEEVLERFYRASGQLKVPAPRGANKA